MSARADRIGHRPAAILAADVGGYSHLIEADEEGTLGRLKALRAEVIRSRTLVPKI
jgi:adenylate cyclase